MEILSTGEKIKRARVYKGLTLKELCEDKISVSKMSCIENNKIKAEPWILEFISQKLDIEYKYLKKDTKEHLLENLERIKIQINEQDCEEEIRHNLEYAELYKYYDIAMQLMHLLFVKHLDSNNLQTLEELQCRYYDIYEKVYSIKTHRIYYIDMAKYLYLSKEYLQAANYYNNVRQNIEISNEDNFNEFTTIIYNEASCYVMLKSYDRAYEIIMEAIEYVDDLENELLKAEIYHMMAFLCLRMNDKRFAEFEKKALKSYKSDSIHKAKAMNEYASIMLELGLKTEGLEYIEKGLKVCPKDDKKTYVDFLLTVCSILIKNKYIDKAEGICSKALDYAINLDEINLVERAYYIKALICIEFNNEYSAEMYMNLALDSLIKFASKKDIHDRYLAMGKMYFKFKNTREALKYFNLAISLKGYI